MAQPYGTGAAELWAGVGPSHGPLFLGWCERNPIMQVRPQYSPVYCDIAGAVPLDEMYGGQDGLVTADLTVYNETIYAVIADKAVAGTGLGTLRGRELPGELGTLMVTEGAAYPLWIRFPYAAKPLMGGPAAPGGPMPAGYRWAAAFLMNDDIPEFGQTRAKKLHLVWHCLRVFDPSAASVLGAGSFLLFDHNMAGLGVAA